MIGKTISHYQILEKLGEGGMGVVYLAEDTQLKRPVVLKFLPPELTRDPETKKRFVHEAQMASSLDHPNICTTHEIDETEDDQLFICMAYYEGETVKEKIEQGSLHGEEAVDIALQVAQGLARPHEAGIIHRDIKPANIMITKRDEVKILDFGLAKLVGQTRLTRTGTTMGTVAYMSPEQARGGEVDHRTDIWSLGVVLYEMVTGQLPFKGEYDQAVVYSILNEPPKPLATLPKDIPNYLEQVVSKALEKDPENRYQSMADISAELKKTEPVSGGEPEPEKSIVVLPFVNMSPDPEQEYFSDGLTEEIITDLSHLHELRVISRTSAMRLKATDKDMRTITQELKVQYVLEGSVRKAGTNLRITAQLIDAVNDTHLWAEKYSGTLDDVFDIQEQVSRSIVDALKLKLTPEEDQEIAERPIDNVQAYECYLRARREILRLTGDGLDRGLRELQSGLEMVGENSLLYFGMGLAYIYYIETGIKADEETLQKAEESAHKALILNPNSSNNYHLLGMIVRIRGGALKAIKHFEKALSIDPDCPDALSALIAIYALQAGKAHAAAPLITRLLEIDPLTPLNYLFIGFVYWMEGKLDQALASIETMIKLEPENLHAQVWRVYLLAWQKKYDRVFELIDQIVQKESLDPVHGIISEWLLFFKYGLQGERKKALDILTEEVRKYVWNDPELPWIWVCHYALIDEKEESLNWLERAINRGWINYPLFAEQDPFLDNIRGEERFKKLMERVKVEWENFEV